MNDTRPKRGGYRGGGDNRLTRRIPWETVTALRVEWAQQMAALGLEGDEWKAIPGFKVRRMLDDEGLPTQKALAAKYGIHPVKVHEIVKGKRYVFPVREPVKP